eukprot:178775-Amphidinium_carterae.2
MVLGGPGPGRTVGRFAPKVQGMFLEHVKVVQNLVASTALASRCDPDSATRDVHRKRFCSVFYKWQQNGLAVCESRQGPGCLWRGGTDCWNETSVLCCVNWSCKFGRHSSDSLECAGGSTNV